MDSDVRPPVQKGLVQLTDEKALAADLVQGAVQDLVPGGFHGNKLHLIVRVVLLDEIGDDLGLEHRQPAFPASHKQFFHCSNSLLICPARWATAA